MTVEKLAAMPNGVKRFLALYSGGVTVVIRNDAPMTYCGDSPSYRTRTFTLTDAQIGQLGLAKDETLSQAIFEPHNVCPTCGQAIISNEHRFPDEAPEDDSWSGGFAPNH